jgi:hypothetical protein
MARDSKAKFEETQRRQGIFRGSKLLIQQSNWTASVRPRLLDGRWFLLKYQAHSARLLPMRTYGATATIWISGTRSWPLPRPLRRRDE